MGKETYILCFKSVVAIALVSCTLIDPNLLYLLVASSSLCFSYFSFQKKRFKWSLFYLLIAVTYSFILQLRINSSSWLLINYFVALVFLASMLSCYFFNYLAFSYLNKKEYQLAEKFAIKAVEAANDIFGTRESVYTESLTSLADLYFTQGKYQNAEEKYKTVLDLKTTTKDIDNLETSFTLNNLGLTYNHLHKYSDAESCFRKSLQIRERFLKENEPEIAEALNNLALPLHSQLRHTESEPLFKKAIVIWENAGSDYELNLATTLNNLAQVYILQDKHADAETLLTRALPIKERILGLHHSDVISSLNNLALAYYYQNKNKEADEIIERVLKITEKDEVHSLLPQENTDSSAEQEVLVENTTQPEKEVKKDIESSLAPATISTAPTRSTTCNEMTVNYTYDDNQLLNPTCLSSELDYLFGETEETNDS